MSQTNNLVHTKGTKWLKDFNPHFTIVPEHNATKLDKLRSLETAFYNKFGANTYNEFIIILRKLFAENPQDREALRNFENTRLRTSLLQLEGQKFNPFKEKFEVCLQVNNADLIGTVFNKALKDKLDANGKYNITLELNREGFRQIAKDLFGSRAQKGKKSFSTIRKNLQEGFSNAIAEMANGDEQEFSKLFSFKLTNNETTFGMKQFLETLDRDAYKYPWGYSKEELKAADKDPNENSILRQELTSAKETIKQYILSLVSGGSELLQDCTKEVWNKKIEGKFENLSFFTGSGGTFMHGVIGALGEFQYAVFNLYINKKLQTLGVKDPKIVGDLKNYNTYNSESPKTDVEILSENGKRWGIQVKNYNLFANTQRIPTTIHPRQFVDLIDDVPDSDKSDFLTFLANAFFDEDYRIESYNEDKVIEFISNNLGELFSFTVAQELTDTVCFYFIGGQNFIPASSILAAAMDTSRKDKFLGDIKITGPQAITESEFHAHEKGKDPLFTKYWLRDKTSPTGWRPRPSSDSGGDVGNKKAFDNLVTNSISIRSSFKFRELLNGTNIYTA